MMSRFAAPHRPSKLCAAKSSIEPRIPCAHETPSDCQGSNRYDIYQRVRAHYSVRFKCRWTYWRSRLSGHRDGRLSLLDPAWFCRSKWYGIVRPDDQCHRNQRVKWTCRRRRRILTFDASPKLLAACAASSDAAPLRRGRFFLPGTHVAGRPDPLSKNHIAHVGPRTEDPLFHELEPRPAPRFNAQQRPSAANLFAVPHE